MVFRFEQKKLFLLIEVIHDENEKKSQYQNTSQDIYAHKKIQVGVTLFFVV